MQKVTYNVSKWIKISLLIDIEEMNNLFHSLPCFQLYQVQRIVLEGEGVLHPSAFLENYAHYIDCLKKGEAPFSSPSFFSPVLSVSEEALYVLPIEGGRQIYKPFLPVVQMQAHAFRYSSFDHSFRSQLFGSDGISWGIQLGYPQLYENPTTHEVVATRTLLNGELFHTIQRWMRKNTLPTPFLVEGRCQNVAFRLGKACFSWIHLHPQLKEHGIEVVRKKDPSPVCEK